MKILTGQILRVSRKLFCRSTEIQRVSSWRKLRQGVSYELSVTMKPIFSSFGIPENGFGVLFFRKQLLM